MGTWSPGPGPTGGDDIYTGDPTVDVADAGAGADTLSGFGGADELIGGDGDDVIYGYAAGGEGAIVSTVAFTGLAGPVAGATAPGDDGFIYFVERNTGVIARINESTGARTDFLDIPQEDFSRGGERGVLGLAFHPQYETNGRFFVFLTDPDGDLQVREYHRSTSNPNVADPASTLVIEIPHQDASNHNGGWIGFSPIDGDLYISTGDGGGGGDPDNNAQNLNVLLGKILRLDVDGDDFPTDANRNYAIPDENPFVGASGADEIWAYGLRNPWRAAFDPRNGDLYIGDVGQSAREEIDYLADGEGGVNFGWRIMEGNLPFNPGPPGTPQPGDPSLRLPIYDYPRTVGTTVTGGEIYNGSNAGFVGQYVFADFGSDRLFSLSVADGAAVDVAERNVQIVGPMPSSVVDFVTGTGGALYAIGIGGAVWRLTPALGAEDVGDTLSGGDGHDQLFGQAGDDVLQGESGNDTLNGGIGADQLIGGTGADTADYSTSTSRVIVRLGDSVAEGDAEGDTFSSIENATGGSASDSLVGSAAANVLRGGASADFLAGLTGNDTLIGDAGNDRLVGAAGADSLNGGSGTDLADYANATTRVVVRLDEGTGARGDAQGDTLISIENVTGGSASDSIVGSNAGNVLRGGASADFLAGLAGNDTLIGDAGDDRLVGAAGADALSGGSGADLADYANAAARVVVRLVDGTGAQGDAQGDTLTSIENVTGGSASDSIVGSDAANVLRGGASGDFLAGLLGNDTLVGGAGNDRLVGGDGGDAFVFDTALAANIDRIDDFVVADDVIHLSTAIFNVGAGTLAASAFAIGAAAADADDRIIYNDLTSALYYDADGNGAGAQVQFATLAPALALTNDDFFGFGP